jgi:uncharacterized coiled-coil DUF342 family protein
MSDEIKARFTFVNEKLDDMKADISEVKISAAAIAASVAALAVAQAVQNKILEVNTDQLREHIRRTNALETRVEQTAEAFRAELRPVEDHVRFVDKAMKVATWLFAIAAATATVAKMFP